MTYTLITEGKEEKREVPTSWDQVSFNQFRSLEKSEPVDALSVLWGIDKEVLKRSRIVGFDDLAFTLAFMRTPVDITIVPKTIAGVKLPADLNFQEVGRYWDIKMIYDSFIDSDNKFVVDLDRFADIVAIAVMPNYLDANKELQEAFIAKIGEQPCGEVMAIANFYLVRLHLLNTATGRSSSNTSTRKKSWKLATQNWYRNLGITVRLWLWKKRLHLIETKSSK